MHTPYGYHINICWLFSPVQILRRASTNEFLSAWVAPKLWIQHHQRPANDRVLKTQWWAMRSTDDKSPATPESYIKLLAAIVLAIWCLISAVKDIKNRLRQMSSLCLGAPNLWIQHSYSVVKPVDIIVDVTEKKSHRFPIGFVKKLFSQQSWTPKCRVLPVCQVFYDDFWWRLFCWICLHKPVVWHWQEVTDKWQVVGGI